MNVTAKSIASIPSGGFGSLFDDKLSGGEKALSLVTGGVSGLFGKNKKKRKPRYDDGWTATQKLQHKYVREGKATLGAYEKLYDRSLAAQQKGTRDYAQMTADTYEDIYGPLSRQQAALSDHAKRAQDLSDFQSMGADFTEALLNADPAQAALRQQINEEASSQLAMGSQLSPVELRRAQQQSRMNRTGQGFGQGSENDLMTEALNILTQGQALRQQRYGNALAAGDFNQRTAGDPLLAVTGRPSGALGFASQAYSQGAAGTPNYTPFTNAITHDTYSMEESFKLQNMLSKRQAATEKQGQILGLAGSAMSALGGAAAAF